MSVQVLCCRLIVYLSTCLLVYLSTCLLVYLSGPDCCLSGPGFAVNIRGKSLKDAADAGIAYACSAPDIEHFRGVTHWTGNSLCVRISRDQPVPGGPVQFSIECGKRDPSGVLGTWGRPCFECLPMAEYYFAVSLTDVGDTVSVLRPGAPGRAGAGALAGAEGPLAAC
jgi:hypothetical protein